MNAELNPPPISKPEGKKKISVLALPLAFVPSVLLLMLFTLFGRGNPPATLYFVFCGISIVCCFVSAFLLFRRNTTLTILFGLLFLLLNGAISFFFGCAAILTGAKF